MNSREVFIHIHQGCIAGTGVIVRLPQCQWSKPDGYGKISQCITTTKRSKAKTGCIYLGIYCTYIYSHTRPTVWTISKCVTLCVPWVQSYRWSLESVLNLTLQSLLLEFSLYYVAWYTTILQLEQVNARVVRNGTLFIYCLLFDLWKYLVSMQSDSWSSCSVGFVGLIDSLLKSHPYR